jgi:hypothetical protein
METAGAGRFRIRNLAVVQYNMMLPIDGYHEYCRHNLRAPFFLGPSALVVHKRSMGRWHVCGTGSGRLSSVQRLGSTSCVKA